MASRDSKFGRRGESEPAWLGAEALPGGLAAIRDDIQRNADLMDGRERTSNRRNFPAGLLDLAARWMKNATRLN